MVVLPFLKLCWGPAAQDPALLPGSPAHMHQTWFKTKTFKNAQRFQVRAPLIKVEKLPFHIHVLQDPEQLQGEITGEMAAGEGTMVGMVLGHSLPPAPSSLRVSLASPVRPKKHILKGMLTPQHRLVQKYPSAFVGFYCYAVFCIEG